MADAELRSFIPYEVPLHPGGGPNETARLVLPADLTIEEGERLAAFIKSLAFDLESTTASLPKRKD